MGRVVAVWFSDAMFVCVCLFGLILNISKRPKSDEDGLPVLSAANEC